MGRKCLLKLPTLPFSKLASETTIYNVANNTIYNVANNTIYNVANKSPVLSVCLSAPVSTGTHTCGSQETLLGDIPQEPVCVCVCVCVCMCTCAQVQARTRAHVHPWGPEVDISVFLDCCIPYFSETGYRGGSGANVLFPNWFLTCPKEAMGQLLGRRNRQDFWVPGSKRQIQGEERQSSPCF